MDISGYKLVLFISPVGPLVGQSARPLVRPLVHPSSIYSFIYLFTVYAAMTLHEHTAGSQE